MTCLVGFCIDKCFLGQSLSRWFRPMQFCKVDETVAFWTGLNQHSCFLFLKFQKSKILCFLEIHTAFQSSWTEKKLGFRSKSLRALFFSIDGAFDGLVKWSFWWFGEMDGCWLMASSSPGLIIGRDQCRSRPNTNSWKNENTFGYKYKWNANS